MRRLPWIILTVLVIVVGGYSVFWYLQAQNVKEVFTEVTRQLPETTSKDGTKVSLTYDKLGVTGYPFSYKVTYKNPVFSWTKNNAVDVKPFTPAEGLQPANTIKINGDLMFESNYLASTLGVSMNGSMDGTTPTPDGFMSWQANWDDDAGCQFEITGEARSKLLKGAEVMSLFKNTNDFMNNLREARCTSTANTVKRMPDGKQIFSSPGSDVNLALTPLDDINSRVELKMQAKDVLFTKEYGSIFAGLSEETSIPQGGGYSQFDERAGKTNIDIDLVATGPFRSEGELPAAYSLDIQSRAFSIKNDWYEVNLPLTLKLQKTETSSNFTIKHDGLLRFSKEMEIALRNDSLTSGRAYQELKDMFENEGKLPPSPSALTQTGIFPELSSFGTIKTFADAATDEAGKTLTIQSIGASSDLYSFNANGNASLVDGNADITFTCDHCVTMLDDGFSYYNRVQDFLRQVNPNAKVAMFGADQTEAMKNLLISLDTDPATPDQITIQYKRTGQTQTLTGQPLEQVIMQAMLIIATPPTAAGTAEPPSNAPSNPSAEGTTKKPVENPAR